MKRKEFNDALVARIPRYESFDGVFNFNDSQQTSHFTRSLEAARKKVYNTPYRKFKYRDYIPLTKGGGLGIGSIITEVYNEVGKAKVIAGSGTDIPKVGITQTEGATPVRLIAAAWNMTMQELAIARTAGKNISTRKASMASTANHAELNDVAWFGNEESGLGGFLDGPAESFATGANAAARIWLNADGSANKTPVEILNDINQAITQVVDESDETFMPDTVLLPTKQYNYIATTPISVDNSQTILSWLISTSPFLNGAESVGSLPELNGVFDDGGQGIDGMVVYEKNEEYVTMHIPQDILTLPPIQKDLAFDNIVMCSTAGVEWVAPESARIIKGI